MRVQCNAGSRMLVWQLAAIRSDRCMQVLHSRTATVSTDMGFLGIRFVQCLAQQGSIHSNRQLTIIYDFDALYLTRLCVL